MTLPAPEDTTHKLVDNGKGALTYRIPLDDSASTS
jgi:hypothetical protein